MVNSLSKLVLLSHPSKLFTERVLLDALLEEGIPCFHLRKKIETLEAHKNYLNPINKPYRSNIIVHEHSELVEQYGLKGVHFKSTSERSFEPQNYIQGRSVHSFEEAEKHSEYDYLYLSPIFDSISKEGYVSGFKESDIKYFLKNWAGKAKIYALGGIDPDNARRALDMGFYGVASLGCVWYEFMYTKSISNFKQLKEICR